MLAIEANDEWLVGRSYMSQHTMDLLRDPRVGPGEGEESLQLQAA